MEICLITKRPRVVSTTDSLKVHTFSGNAARKRIEHLVHWMYHENELNVSRNRNEHLLHWMYHDPIDTLLRLNSSRIKWKKDNSPNIMRAQQQGHARILFGPALMMDFEEKDTGINK